MKFSNKLTLAAIALMSAGTTDARIGQRNLEQEESTGNFVCREGNCRGKEYPFCTNSIMCNNQCHAMWLDCSEQIGCVD